MKEINSILIANRGEIASRVIRTCRKMGIRSIAVYSDADRNAIFVQQADMAIYIGESQANASYLNQDKIIEAAKASNADAIHPGYGFLSENADFSKRCAAEEIIFIGPKAEVIEAMGSKSSAKQLMDQHSVPTVPGYQGTAQSEKVLIEKAIEIGFPLLLKAAAGGGGKGMRIVEKEGDLKQAIQAAKSEAKNAFGNDELIIEKYISAGRHIEFQIFGDQHKNVIHLLERECSIQRRYQKIVEESPSPIMTDELRIEMGNITIKAAKALNYDNAGTVEFIFDEQTNEYYFLEINTRLQVEHLVTEAITGLDLVQMQIESAEGKRLSITQKDIKANGYAVEVRLYAEDANNNFAPDAGQIKYFKAPQVDGLFVESSIESGSNVSVYYDPMIAKLIVWAEDRSIAHKKMHYVLCQLNCLGISTNQNFLRLLFENEDFKNGIYNTNFISNNPQLFEELEKNDSTKNNAAIAATLFQWNKRQQKQGLLKAMPSGWRNNLYQGQKESFLHNEETIILTYQFTNIHFEISIKDVDYKVKFISCTEENLMVEIDGILLQFSIAKKGNEYYIHNESNGNLKLIQTFTYSRKIKGCWRI